MFEIGRALSITKTKHHASPDSPFTSTSTNTASSTSKPLLFPYHPDLSSLNHVIRESGFRFIFISRNTIGRNFVSKCGRNAASSHQLSGVYIITCNFPGCHQHYYGRSLRFGKRVTQHVKDYNSRNPTKPL